MFTGNLFASGGAKDEEKEDGGDEVVMNNLMHDIKEGFIQRRLPDGGFKVSINHEQIVRVFAGHIMYL